MSIRVSVVTRNGHEIEWFECDKDAAAFVQHVYGLSIYDLIESKEIAITGIDSRGPKPGDVFRTAGGDAILGGDGLAARNARTFRVDGRVSCSGGPFEPVDISRLRLVGLERVKFWRWADSYPGANNDGYYYITVPVWTS
jgi:hypothetical protein